MRPPRTQPSALQGRVRISGWASDQKTRTSPHQRSPHRQTNSAQGGPLHILYWNWEHHRPAHIPRRFSQLSNTHGDVSACSCALTEALHVGFSPSRFRGRGHGRSAGRLLAGGRVFRHGLIVARCASWYKGGGPVQPSDSLSCQVTA